jgi:hypothetical protein
MMPVVVSAGELRVRTARSPACCPTAPGYAAYSAALKQEKVLARLDSERRTVAARRGGLPAEGVPRYRAERALPGGVGAVPGFTPARHELPPGIAEQPEPRPPIASAGRPGVAPSAASRRGSPGPRTGGVAAGPRTPGGAGPGAGAGAISCRVVPRHRGDAGARGADHAPAVGDHLVLAGFPGAGDGDVRADRGGGARVPRGRSVPPRAAGARAVEGGAGVLGGHPRDVPAAAGGSSAHHPGLDDRGAVRGVLGDHRAPVRGGGHGGGGGRDALAVPDGAGVRGRSGGRRRRSRDRGETERASGGRWWWAGCCSGCAC